MRDSFVEEPESKDELFERFVRELLCVYVCVSFFFRRC